MKQLLLRVPDHLHQRLAARAARENRSVNAVATEILDATAEADQGDRRSRLRAKAAAAGILRSVPAPTVSRAKRARAIQSLRGIGPMVDQTIAEDRERR